MTLFEKIAVLARCHAVEKRKDAGMNGEWHDGGAKELESLVTAWEAGLRQEIPDSLKPYAEKAKKLTKG